MKLVALGTARQISSRRGTHIVPRGFPKARAVVFFDTRQLAPLPTVYFHFFSHNGVGGAG